jgi:hypothetical protein
LLENIKLKKCTKCQIEKLINEFNKLTNHKFKTICKKCLNLYNKEYNVKNNTILLKKKHCYRQQNADKLHQSAKQWREENKEKHLENGRKWREQNKNYHNIRRKTNLQYKISSNLRSRLSQALRNNQKVGSAVNDLGCSIDELKTHLESKFTEGMTWTNYGEWHIDHIKPLALFNLQDRSHFLEACHYSNLQPLWAKDNLSKGSRILSS